MILEEAIKHEEEVAEENQRVVDTGIVFDDVTIDMLYCDDTEVIEEHLANYQMCADEHRQLAEWLKDYKRLLEQEPCDDAISRQEVVSYLCAHCPDDAECFNDCDDIKNIKSLPSVRPQEPKIGYWIDSSNGWMCSECNNDNTFDTKYCPNCGVKMEREEL